MLTENEIDRIAASVNALRPDWPAKSLRTLIADKLAHRTRRDVAVALTWVACESETKTPKRVLEAGPWWQGLGQEVRVPRNPSEDEQCPARNSKGALIHPGQFAASCSGCASERLAPVLDIRGSDRRADASDVRAMLRIATSDLCSHGVQPRHCHETHETETEESDE